MVQVHDLASLVRPEWPPLRHVRRGWEHLTETERADVAARVEKVLAGHVWGTQSKDALLHLFTFLAQVETIAIEIPLRFLPHASADIKPLLRRQLVDEVFHSTLFARLAHELAAPATQPPAPLLSAERLLERIRKEPDLAVTATLLNLVAEGWIETLFKHALKWRISPTVFQAVLADEARHVDEASAYTKGMDLGAAQQAVRAFEQGMLEVGLEPTVALAILDIAGETGQRRLAQDLYAQHRKNLAAAGLAPSAEWDAMVAASEQTITNASALDRARRVEDTTWRRLARRVWTTPRDPTMQGDFDLPIGHVPRKLLTPVIIAALGRAWAANPELNRIIARDGLWQLPYANVGVRVLLDDNELATVVIPEAHRRSVRDIQRMLGDGIAQLKRSKAAATDDRRVPEPEVAALMPALPHMFAVAISNAGKWGVISGAGSFSGWVSPSTDITIGLRRRLPLWKGVAYLPAWHVNIAAIQDHRVFDGRGSATTVTSIQHALSPAGVRAILAAPDTLAADADLPPLPDRSASPAAGTPAFAMLGVLGLPKYAPIAIGGLGLGALFGVGGYLLYQNLNTPGLMAAPAVAKSGFSQTPAKAGQPALAPVTPAGPMPSAKALEGRPRAPTKPATKAPIKPPSTPPSAPSTATRPPRKP